MKRAVLLWLLVAACGGSTSGGPAPTGPVAPGSAPTAPAGETKSFDVGAAVKLNLDKLNAYRAQENLPLFTLDDALSASATQGSLAFAAGGPPHGYFRAHRDEIKASAHANVINENQGKRGGHSSNPPPVDQFVATQVDTLITNMFNEGPGGGHHDAIVNPRFRRVGISIELVGQFVYLTNDFAD